MEIVRNYDIDGFHLDYIRWNEYTSSTTSKEFEKLQVENNLLDGEITVEQIEELTDNLAGRYLYDIEHPYSAGIPSGFATWEDWWRWSVTEFVKTLHDSIQAVKPYVRLSVAALGKYNWSSWNGYGYVFQDAALWFNQGYIEQIAGMHYHWPTGSGFYGMLTGACPQCWGQFIQPGIAAKRFWLLEDFFLVCSRNGVRTLNESGLTPRQYYDASRRFVDVQVEGNKAFRKPVVADPPPSPKCSRGDVAILTDGARGAKDFKVRCLGWEGPDVDLVLDLGDAAPASEASISTLWDARSWILHPRSVTCLVSTDGLRYQAVKTIRVEGDQRAEDVTRTFTFSWAMSGIRFIKLHVEGTKTLPDWHASAGGTSWVFVPPRWVSCSRSSRWGGESKARCWASAPATSGARCETSAPPSPMTG